MFAPVAAPAPAPTAVPFCVVVIQPVANIEIEATHIAAKIILLLICFSPIKYLTDINGMIFNTFYHVLLFQTDTIKRPPPCQHFYNYYFHNELQLKNPKKFTPLLTTHHALILFPMVEQHLSLRVLYHVLYA